MDADYAVSENASRKVPSATGAGAADPLAGLAARCERRDRKLDLRAPPRSGTGLLSGPVGGAWLSKMFSGTNFHASDLVTANRDNSKFEQGGGRDRHFAALNSPFHVIAQKMAKGLVALDVTPFIRQGSAAKKKSQRFSSAQTSASSVRFTLSISHRPRATSATV
jgi:hypothetical protein